MDDLEAVLKGDASDEVEEVESVEETESTDEQEEEPTGEEQAKAETKEPEPEKEESTPDSENADKGQWQYEAYKDEKRKRQELETELKELRKQVEQKQKEPEKAPDVFEDQDAYTAHVASLVDQSVFNTRTEMSKFMADREYGADVVMQKLEQFKAMAADNPKFTEDILKSPSPYHAMIDIVDKAAKAEELKNVDALEAKVRAEIEEKIRKEIEDKYKAKQSKRDSVTPSLNNSASVKGAPEGDAQDLKSILGR